MRKLLNIFRTNLNLRQSTFDLLTLQELWPAVFSETDGHQTEINRWICTNRGRPTPALSTNASVETLELQRNPWKQPEESGEERRRYQLCSNKQSAAAVIGLDPSACRICCPPREPGRPTAAPPPVTARKGCLTPVRFASGPRGSSIPRWGLGGVALQENGTPRLPVRQ